MLRHGQQNSLLISSPSGSEMILIIPEDTQLDSRDLGEMVPNARLPFGREIPQPNTGKSVEHVNAAMERFHTFHKKEPHRLVEIDPKHAIPARVDRIGDLLSIAYRSDKWYADGKDVDYRHVIEQGGQTLYEPRGSQRWAEKTKLPVAVPKVVTLLGKSLGLFVKREDDGVTYESNPKNSYLFCSPSGNMLLLYSPTEGFIAMACGGQLSVKEHGIDG